MHFRALLLPCLALSTFICGCTPDSKNIGATLDTDSDSTGTAGDATEGQSGTGDIPSTSLDSAGTTGDDDSASDPSVSGTSGPGTSAGTTGDDDSDSDPSVSGTSGPNPDETTGASEGFQRFTLRTSAGPCPPMADCDGFIELTSAGILRVEKFGEVGNPVLEVEIEGTDFALALEAFAAPALIEVLDSPDPLCDPPTDIFEQMELVIDGTQHDAATTTCAQAPLQAARDAAEALRTKYAP